MEKFFLIGSQVNEIELKEILLRRYGRYDFPEMSFNEYIDFIVLAITKERKDELRGLYHSLIPIYITKLGKYISFEEFYDNMTGANLDFRPADEILREAEEIQARFKNGS